MTANLERGCGGFERAVDDKERVGTSVTDSDEQPTWPAGPWGLLLRSHVGSKGVVSVLWLETERKGPEAGDI